MLELEIHAHRKGAGTGICTIVDACTILTGKDFGVETRIGGEGKDILYLPVYLEEIGRAHV